VVSRMQQIENVGVRGMKGCRQAIGGFAAGAGDVKKLVELGSSQGKFGRTGLDSPCELS
jgi:hypothetical protein